MKSNKQIIFICILLVIVAIGVYYYFDKNKSNNQPISQSSASQIQTSTVSSPSITAKKDELSYDGTLYYTNVSNNIYEIYNKKSSNNPTLIFTDKDENEKIIYTPSMSSNGKIIVVMAAPDQNFNASLYSINEDGSGQKTKIINKFSTSQAPVINKDGSKIAYVNFSNAEFEYGFSLYVSDTDGNNKVKIDTDPSLISNFIFNFDSNSLIYQKNNKIYQTSLDGKNTNMLYELSSENKITGLCNNVKTTDLLITLQNKILKLNIDTKNVDTLYESTEDTQLNNAYFVSTNEDKIAYIANNNLIIIDLNKKSLTSNLATNIIDWIQ